MEPANKIPAFFKIFIAEDRQQRLRIPLAFSRHMEDMMPDSARLRDLNGNIWPVQIARTGAYHCFEDGWSKFAVENNVQLGDFLVFQYDGTSTFDFKHFDTTTCEKEVEDRDIEIEVTEEDEEGNDEELEVEEEEENEISDNYDEEDGDDDEDDDDEVEFVEEDDDEECVEIESDDDGGENNEENAIFRSGRVDRPKINPFFVAKIQPYRPSDLYVPSDLIRDFNLKLPEKLNIVDENQRRWATKLTVWKDGRTWLSKGWKAFCRWNAVQLEDRCLCEFVPGEGGEDITLHIRILRAGSW